MAHREYRAAFPQLRNALTLVIDAESAELARDSVKRLAEKLTEDSVHFEWVYAPSLGAFFERHGLMFLDLDALDELTQRLTRAQPVLGRLANAPNLVGMAALLEDLAAHNERGFEQPDFFLDSVARTIDAAGAGRQSNLSWAAVMRGRPSTPAERRQYLIVKPKLDFNTWLAAEPGINRVRELAQSLQLDAARGIRLRVTGGIRARTRGIAEREPWCAHRGAGCARLSRGNFALGSAFCLADSR